MRVFSYIILLWVALSAPIMAQTDKFKVVLDAGHGGKDPGKVHGKVYEKDIVLKIALLVGNILEKDPNYKVTYTRKTDKFIELYERGHIANKAKADLFISIHCNAAKSPQAFGVETFVLGLHANNLNFEVAKTENEVIYLEDNYQDKYAEYDINSPESFIGLSIMQEEFLEQSIQMAKGIQNNFTQELNRKNRGVKQAGFIVLHQTYMPSILIETGFLTNTDERNYLVSEKGQQEIADNIVKAIKTYREWIKNNSSTAPTQPVDTTSKSVQPAQSIIYRVQIATSNRNIAEKPQNFKGLSPIFKEENNKLYRYYYGREIEFKSAQKLLNIAKKKGFPDAFIVPFVDGKRSTMEDLR
ncbi:N-acetylmuramoyl-L-alanine amidase [Capnocytophaga catalasegens]|uniref:N-acetylmuramoyl-L-alanine amidase n=1 Tax=Capnocytophaga catalasegens TaxID=1004260 RepID=A0AAV5AVN7_9FLAO|nr:N-acetylmuramoyl-L-alanine amidase [Capnocytophaga catalasegens]GIZ15040.1 N-acetylmuramoyl-L-alanine amidase [Capnocytophaga catalasegens]GJM49420.1 N-acetylmuramoyl-L-alanine amidase [Capnocytophaga catalasegens]GJM52570.1 N-acetylmuramoyl-L-alanine amidase [Capnocytophaga catalasegens]